MRPVRPFLFALCSLAPVALAACATTGATTSASRRTKTVTVDVLRGEHTGKRLDVKVSSSPRPAGNGAPAGAPEGAVTLQLELANHGDQPIGVEVAQIVIEDDQGETHKPLGREQSFQKQDGERVTQRVPYGAETIEPAANLTLKLDLDPLPTGRTLTLVIPELARLGIEGNVTMKPVRIELRVEKSTATVAATDEAGGKGGGAEGEAGAFYDPFEH